MIATIDLLEMAPSVSSSHAREVEEETVRFDLAGCLQRVRKSDQGAARELVDHLYPMVIRIVHCHLPRRVDAEDLAQDIFLKIFTRLSQYQGVVPFTHWVSRIAVTTCIDQLRAQKRRPEFRWSDLSETEADTLDSVMTNESDIGVPDALAARDLVHKLLEQLSASDRVVIQLLDLERRSIAEISRLTGLTEGVVKVRAHRARRKLQVLFQELRCRERS